MKRRKADRMDVTFRNPVIPNSAALDAYKAELARSIGISPAVVPGTLAAGGRVEPEPEPKPEPLTEFGAPEFSIEPVKGARAFDVDKYGRLRGVTYEQVWTPGENLAECRQDSLSAGLRSLSITLYGHTGGYVPFSTETQQRSTRDPHSLVGCKHGFYGYYDGSNDYYRPDRVSGVIEGYGEVVVGTRGFRATKARIIALHIPADVPYGMRQRVQRNYRDIPCFDTFEAMVAEHPTDTGLIASPETDPDFWTRP